MRRLHEAARDWQPCSVCGRAAPYEHNGRRYCVRNACQLTAALCGCRSTCGDDGDVDGPDTCQGLPRAPAPPLIEVVLVPRSRRQS